MNADVILVPIDLSSPVEPVVEMSVVLARALDSVVTLLHAVHLPVGVPPAGALPIGLVDTETAVRVLDEEAANYLQSIAQRYVAAAVPVSHMIRHGEPAEVILEAAEELRARHIVMGTHGRRGLERALVGSVAERVLRRSGCPVTIVRNPD